MSSPTAPMRSQADSAASSSPWSSASCATPLQLTPRSKVRALLAAVGDDSDSEDCLGVQNHHTITSKLNGTGNIPQTINATKIGDLCKQSRSEDLPIIPRGRLVTRLYGRKVPQIDPPTADGESSGGNPHERIKDENPLTGPATRAEEKPLEFTQDVSLSREVSPTLRSPIHSGQSRSRSNSSQSPSKSAIGSKTALPCQDMTPTPTVFGQLSRRAASDNDSDSDLPPDPQISTKLQLLVARKKEALRVKEQAEAQEKEAKIRNIPKKWPAPGGLMTEISDSDSENRANERKLTQQNRPTRKASKKALEEINRETQRMSRNMQLAHQAKTRKKITKESFFTRFNFRGDPHVTDATLAISSSTVGSSAPASDMEGIDRESPPTSPDRPIDSPCEPLEPSRISHADERVVTLKDVEGVLPSGFCILDAPLTMLHEQNKQSKATSNLETLSYPPPRLRSLKYALHSVNEGFGSDSELEILPVKKPKRSKLDVFDRLPAYNLNLNEERSLQTLRTLAHMHSPVKQSGSKSSMTMSDMQTSLQVRARRQAAEERAEKIRDLKERGVIIQTAEERERDQAEIEDLVEKARREAAEITQREKDATRKERLANGELYGTDWTSDEDEDYRANDADESDLDLSGSDEEQPNKDEKRDDSEEETEASSEGEEEVVGIAADDNCSTLLIDAEASEAGEVEALEGISDGGDVEDQQDEVFHIPRAKRKRTNHFIIEDDEEDEEGEFDIQQRLGAVFGNMQKPPIPGLPFSNAMPMGMTQAFAATMADPQLNTQMVGNADPDEEQDSLAFLGPMPEPNFQMYDLEESQLMVPDSQNTSTQPGVDCGVDETLTPKIGIHFSQTLVHYTQDIHTATQDTEIPDPTQDAGFSKTSPIRNRFVSVPPSTVETILLSGAVRSSTIVKKKGRLRRRADVPDDLPHVKVSPHGDLADFDGSGDAFEVMKNASRNPAASADVFDKNKSEARGMVDEQAQESEDEYAGLGGVSDDENAGEENEEDRKMIDEEEVNVDERKLAAYYA